MAVMKQRAARWWEDGTYLIYVRGVFVGRSKGRNGDQAIDRHISSCGFESRSEYARECFASTGEIEARRAGVWQ